MSGFSRNHVDLEFAENNGTSWRMTCYYGYPEMINRKKSWDLIRHLAGISQIPWVILGDFNDLLCNEDKLGRSNYPRSLIEGFRATLEDCNLTELELCGGKYTWEKCRGKREWVREKVDRAFSTSSWANKFPLCKLLVHHTTRSDDDPIQLELVSTTISRRLFRYKFENIWLKDPDFKKEVQTYWEKNSSYSSASQVTRGIFFYG